jgi:hypothetical protein
MSALIGFGEQGEASGVFCSAACAIASSDGGIVSLVQGPMLEAPKYLLGGEPRGSLGLFRAPGVQLEVQECAAEVVEYATMFVRGYIAQDGPPVKLQEALDMHCTVGLDASTLYALTFTMKPEKLDMDCLSNARQAGSHCAQIALGTMMQL